MLSESSFPSGALSDLMAGRTVASFFICIVLISSRSTEKLSFHREKEARSNKSLVFKTLASLTVPVFFKQHI